MSLEILEPGATGMDALCDWLAGRRDAVDRAILARGAVVLRGTPLASPDDLARILAVLDEPFEYRAGIGPRRRLGDQVYESTSFPPDAHLRAHNEMPYLDRWPAWIAFACLVAAGAGGETTFADGRAIWSALRPSTRDVFSARRLLYRDSFPASVTPGSVQVPWPVAFATDDPAAAEAACRALGQTPAWTSDGALVTSSVRPATTVHPRTGETAWFNQVLVRNRGLIASDPAARRRFEWRRRELPSTFSCSWEDGEPIAADLVDEINGVVESLEFRWRWRPGDVVVLDNVLSVHGRRPYQGRREVVVGFTSGERLG